MIVILDNGHGEDTPGKRSPAWSNGSQLFEYEFNRDLVKQVHGLLMADGISSEILVSGIKDVSIKERCERANAIHRVKPSIMISIHGNAAPNENSGPSGIETFYYSIAGKTLASALQKELVAVLKWKDRGIKSAYQRVRINGGTPQEKEIIVYKIAILKYTNMPTVLTENGFYTNFDQCQEMMNPIIRKNISLAHYSSIKNYLSNLIQTS